MNVHHARQQPISSLRLQILMPVSSRRDTKNKSRRLLKNSSVRSVRVKMRKRISRRSRLLRENFRRIILRILFGRQCNRERQNGRAIEVFIPFRSCNKSKLVRFDNIKFYGEIKRLLSGRISLLSSRLLLLEVCSIINLQQVAVSSLVVVSCCMSLICAI